jgi:hypothetical protein
VRETPTTEGFETDSPVPTRDTCSSSGAAPDWGASL